MRNLIVTGVDGCDGGKDAAALAVALAAGTDAEVLLTGVWQETLLPLPLLLGPQMRPLEEIERMLLTTRAELAPRGITRPLSDLSPARALRRTAREEHADLIVLGSTHAPRGHVRAGQCARQVIHDAPCAVAIAATGVHHEPFAVRRILVGIDGGVESDAALTAARGLARTLGAQLNVLTAGEVRLGDPDTELALAAAAADLVVVGSRHWGRRSRVVIGSIAERLMRDAPCSLMVVPRPAEEASDR
ncbi:universal stress protein [Conexibacter stalactiti]|uniref:Universal stress protein n=1 Tax=Conexibacter stalactiti TaxID=1940611 RepID=A0ABU4HRY2_9ACTN|nr:universal stress protein [Conexibacter stalactiti]MDW5595447.1 universal stress protein [Conexibacter stalactiti]MEC5036089.1 universal stress protein [Conexibacter stalactiti]